jgi:hypothetical protein
LFVDVGTPKSAEPIRTVEYDPPSNGTSQNLECIQVAGLGCGKSAPQMRFGLLAEWPVLGQWPARNQEGNVEAETDLSWPRREVTVRLTEIFNQHDIAVRLVHLRIEQTAAVR